MGIQSDQPDTRIPHRVVNGGSNEGVSRSRGDPVERRG